MSEGGLLADVWIPILHAWPWPLPNSARLWLFLPLALCIATVYRATRARTVYDLPKGILLTFVNIVVGMSAIAIGLYVIYEIAIRQRW